MFKCALCSEQSTFHNQASDRVWSFPNCSFEASLRKKCSSVCFDIDPILAWSYESVFSFIVAELHSARFRQNLAFLKWSLVFTIHVAHFWNYILQMNQVHIYWMKRCTCSPIFSKFHVFESSSDLAEHTSYTYTRTICRMHNRSFCFLNSVSSGNAPRNALSKVKKHTGLEKLRDGSGQTINAPLYTPLPSSASSRARSVLEISGHPAEDEVERRSEKPYLVKLFWDLSPLRFCADLR